MCRGKSQSGLVSEILVHVTVSTFLAIDLVWHSSLDFGDEMYHSQRCVLGHPIGS